MKSREEQEGRKRLCCLHGQGCAWGMRAAGRGAKSRIGITVSKWQGKGKAGKEENRVPSNPLPGSLVGFAECVSTWSDGLQSKTAFKINWTC